MKSFMLAVSVVFPLVVYMSVGGMIRKLSIFSKKQFKDLNGLIFKVFLPLILFVNVYNADVGESVQPDVFIMVILEILATFILTWIIVSYFVKEKADTSAIIQGIYRSNFVLFGTTIVASLSDAEGVALVSALSALVVPLFNILAVILFEVKRGGTVEVSKILINIVKNPLVEAGILGIIFSALHIQIPEIVMDPITKLGNAATPLALVTLGGILSFGSMVKHWKYLAWVSVIHLTVVPFVMLAIDILLGYRGDVLAVVLAVFASPTAVSSVPMAQTMGGNGELAGEIVATTSVLCVFTLFLFVFGLSRMGFI